jgi:hypothetical protein
VRAGGVFGPRLFMSRGVRADQNAGAEIGHLITTPRIRELNRYRQYFDLVAASGRTIEVRVKYPHLANIRAEARYGRDLS